MFGKSIKLLSAFKQKQKQFSFYWEATKKFCFLKNAEAKVKNYFLQDQTIPSIFAYFPIYPLLIN